MEAVLLERYKVIRVQFFNNDHLLLQVACDIKVVVNESLIYASILTIVAFTIER